MTALTATRPTPTTIITSSIKVGGDFWWWDVELTDSADQVSAFESGYTESRWGARRKVKKYTRKFKSLALDAHPRSPLVREPWMDPPGLQ